MKLIRNALSVGAWTAVSRLGGFVREWMQAHFIGASVISDAINYAISFPSFFRRIFAEGAFNASFVPMLSGILASEGAAEAQRFAESILSLLGGTLLLLVTAVVIFSDPIMTLFLPGLCHSPECLSLTISFTRITFPFLLFISLTAFFSGMLNSIERFTAAASSPAMGNLAIIGCLFFAHDFGVNPGQSLAYGILACGLVQFGWVFFPSQWSGIRLGLRVPRLTSHVSTFLRRMAPAALGASVFQLNLIVDMSLASFLPKGAFSYLKYADRFSQLPLSIIGTAISTTLLPLLSTQWRRQETDKAMTSQNRALEFTLFFALPSTICLIFMSYELIDAFYAHGKFSATDIAPTAQTLIALASGLPAYVLVKVFSTSFFAQGDTRTPVNLAIASVVLNFALNMALIGTLQQIALGLSTAISSWFNALALGIILYRRKLFVLDAKFRRFLPRLLLVMSLTTLYSFAANKALYGFLMALGIAPWLSVIGCMGGLGGVYILLAYCLKVFSIQSVKDHLAIS